MDAKLQARIVYYAFQYMLNQYPISAYANIAHEMYDNQTQEVKDSLHCDWYVDKEWITDEFQQN